MPWASLILAFLAGLVFLLPFPSWHSLVGLVTGASVLMYAGAPLSLGAFRGQVPDAVRPYRLGAAAVWAPAGFIIANFIIYWSGFEVIWKLGICIVIGYVIIGVCMAFDPQRPKMGIAELEGRQLAAGLPDRHGHHLVARPVQRRRERSPRSTPTASALWCDLVIIAAFSLVIYYWALYAKLPREEMLALVNAQAAEKDVPPETLI